MSTRHLLNMTMGAFALLLLAAGGVLISTQGDTGDQHARIELAMRQQVLVQELSRHAATLASAEDRPSVEAAREGLAQTVMQFDRNLNALLDGGTIVNAAGSPLAVGRTRNEAARAALAEATELWRDTGSPLADLAAGEFSVFSAAGQKAVAGLQSNNVELMQHMGAAANSMRMGLHARSTVARLAGWATGALTLVLIGLGLFRRRLLAAESGVESGAEAAPRAKDIPDLRSDPNAHGPVRPILRHPAAGTAPSQGLGAFASPLSFDSVNASVDQMTVDMNTIAGSTEKMRVAIGTVGNALQGMLYSLNEMAQDTAEGHRIVRNANNAASYTATTAGTLAASAREMAEVVARVTQLAQKTRQVAALIDADAIQTGQTGESFTSVVAGEVKGLARQTNQATREIEDTVAAILQTARQYEEAIGQIIKNVAAINKVSQNLGELMLNPPPRVRPGMVVAGQVDSPAAEAPDVQGADEADPTDPTPVGIEAEPEAVDAGPEPAVEPVAAWPAVPAETVEEPAAPEPTPAEVAAATSDAIEAVAADETAAPPKNQANGNVFMLGSRNKKPGVLNIPAPPPAPEPEPTPEATPTASESVPASTPEAAAAPEPVAIEPAPVGGGSSANVFMLNKPKVAPAAKAPAATETPAEETAPAGTEPDQPATPAPVWDGPNIYGLEVAPEGAFAPAPQTRSRSKTQAAGKPAAAPEALADQPPAVEAPVPETVPAGPTDETGQPGSNANIFMLNKPR